ncbi:hypothetical protein B0I22_2025 [Epilithonimonas xixisoli]|uniref:Uncharacterized protein n=1 Tax=Epilithonimonas xixisoli TaxID=1476462 RepID=A0A4R8I631_9FLAO|nr:hypothetical protein B0I22_2025 [Epilithonimonas xixisoli]
MVSLNNKEFHLGNYFRLPLPIFFADDFSLIELEVKAKKDFRSSRAADSA